MAVGEDLKNRARDAFRRRQYDLAVEMYVEALRFNPDDRDNLEGFFQAAVKARETRGKALLGGLLGRLSIGASRDPAKRMHACFRALAKDPDNKAFLLALGEAAGEAGAEEAAAVAFQRATEVDPDDAYAWKCLGDFHGRRGRIREALDALGHAVRLNPRDQESIRLRKNLAAEGALQSGGFVTANSSRELIKDKESVRKTEVEDRIQLTPEHAASEVDRLRAEIAASPDQPRLYVRLADLLLNRGDEPGALEALEQALERDPRNFDVAARIGDLRLRGLEREVAAARQALEADPSSGEAKARLEAAEKRLLESRLEEYGRRVRDHPLDLGERFRLGRTLLAAGRLDEAAAEFQQTVRDPNRKIDSLLLLARCFEQKGLAGLAVKKLEEALADFAAISSPQSKEVHYVYADLLERKGDREKAREVFERIYEVDITYRDVAARLDALARAGGQAG